MAARTTLTRFKPSVPTTAAKAANGAVVAANDAAAATMPQSGTLAERIRALQAHASRARQQGA